MGSGVLLVLGDKPAMPRGFPEELNWEGSDLEKCLLISQDKYNFLWVKAWKNQDYILCQKTQHADSMWYPPVKHNNECLREHSKYFNDFSQVCLSISCLCLMDL